MNMPIKFRFKELVAARERITGEKVTYRDVKEATGINLNTLTALANNDMKMVGLNTIDRLTDFFNCQISDLIVKEE